MTQYEIEFENHSGSARYSSGTEEFRVYAICPQEMMGQRSVLPLTPVKTNSVPRFPVLGRRDVLVLYNMLGLLISIGGLT